MSHCFSVDGKTEADLKGNLAENIALIKESHDKIALDPSHRYITVPCPRAGILPEIRKWAGNVGAKDYFCSFSNRVSPNPDDLCIIYLPETNNPSFF
jgi:hypothetical protein